MQALKLVLAGGIYLPAQVLLDSGITGSNDQTGNVLSADQNASPVAQLSTRQRESILLAIRGASNKTIASELDISEGTVKSHLSSAYRALGVRNRTEALLLLAGLEGNSEKPN